MGSDQDSGASSRVSLAKYDPESSSWKMSQTLLFEDSDASLETFARSGTMRSGKLYQRKTPVRLTCESDSSSSLPTPTASEHKYRLQGNSQGSRCLNARAGGKLNPRWVQWLMGFPGAWLNCVLSETRSSRKSRSSSEEEPCESSNAAQ